MMIVAWVYILTNTPPLPLKQKNQKPRKGSITTAD
jgi:hypothetical protein